MAASSFAASLSRLLAAQLLGPTQLGQQCGSVLVISLPGPLLDAVFPVASDLVPVKA